MVHHAQTRLAPDEVFDRAIAFFSSRVPLEAAFPEQRSPGHLVLRGQGGEEIAIAARVDDGVTRVRAATLMFDGTIRRFLVTLPAAEQPA
jgi:hypothetical protein